MNIILLQQTDFIDIDTVRLKDRRSVHINTILKSKAGDTLRLGLINGQLGNGTVLKTSATSVDIRVRLTVDPPAPARITLILALPRPIVLKRMLGALSSLGVKDIYLIHAKRVEKSYWKSPVLGKKNIEEQFILGLEQSKDTIMPHIHLKDKFKPFIEDELPRIIKKKTAIIAHPGGSTRLIKARKNALVLTIGPEGGFIPYEIDKFVSLGFKTTCFGQRILRVETAVPFILGKLL